MKRAALLIASALPFFSLCSPAHAQRRPRRQQLDLTGKPAPAFTLHRLSFTKDETTGEVKGQISDETVSLADYKDKQPVCLIFSSYT